MDYVSEFSTSFESIVKDNIKNTTNTLLAGGKLDDVQVRTIRKEILTVVIGMLLIHFIFGFVQQNSALFSEAGAKLLRRLRLIHLKKSK